MWEDSIFDNNIHRSDALEHLCYYNFVANNKKVCKTFRQMGDKKDTNNAASGEEYQVPTAELRQNEYPFRESHPGYKFSHFKQRKHEVIPIISLPKGSICRIEELEVSSATPSSITVNKREASEKSA